MADDQLRRRLAKAIAERAAEIREDAAKHERSTFVARRKYQRSRRLERLAEKLNALDSPPTPES